MPAIATSCFEYDEQASLHDMIREDLIAEDIAIESYADIRRRVGHDDFTTRTPIESILTMETQHADDLRSLLATLEPAIVNPEMHDRSEA
jgi:bacterioferritin